MAEAHNAANFAKYKELLARQEFIDQAAWKPATRHGNELIYHAYNRHPSLAMNQFGIVDPRLYDSRARANIVNLESEIHALAGGTQYAAFNKRTGALTRFSWEGRGGLPVGTPTIHSYYIPLRNQMRTGIPFKSEGIVHLREIRPIR